MIEIDRAHPQAAPELTAIAQAAKASWGYPASWLEIWKDVLTITSGFIAENPTFVARSEGAIVGFVALIPRAETRWILEHLWVLPSHMKQGIGPQLVAHAVAYARSQNVLELAIDAEPRAESFYRRMGAVRVGEVVGAIEGQPRVRPQMLLSTHSAAL